MSKRTKKFNLRNLLVTTQFTIAIALMGGTILIYQQLNYISNKNLGYETENILVVNNAESLGDNLKAFKEEISKFPEVISSSISMDMPGRGMWEDIYQREGSDIKLPISQNKIDPDFFPTLGLSLAAGRAFEENRPGDVQGLIINETTEALFDWEEGTAIGKRILYPGYPEELKVIGVVKDFHFQSLRQNITPLMFFHIDAPMWGDIRQVSLRFQQDQEASLLAKIEQEWGQMAPGVPFEYSYLDEETAQNYTQERSLSGLISVFTGFSLFIAIIGLIGLLAYATEQRKKEIGIRKVMGATGFQVFSLLSRQYLLLFIIALILAVPMAIPTMQSWLSSFAFSVPINPLVFILAGLVIVAFLFLSISYWALKINAVNLARVLKEG